ncbi:L,D-transpeptidase family protein [Schaalia naturae]|uniref:L,D-transpeptidase family protein n=1 Tax=Schaalia naturae TaxID=635203 RepID=A0ABW2SPV9_9ACTO
MKRKSARWKLALGGALAIVLVVTGATAGYAAHFSDVALPGVSVAGTSVTGQTQEEVASAVGQRASDITVTVNVDGKPTTAKLADLGVSVDPEATAAKAFEPNASLASRIAALFRHNEVPVVSTTDDAALADFSDQVAAAAGTPVRNGSVALSEDGTQFIATEASSGMGVDISQLTGVVAKAVSALESQAVDVTATEIEPTVSTEAAQQVAAAANALLDLDVTLYGTVSENSATQADKAAWVTIPTTEDGLGAPAFDPAKVTAWVQKAAESTNDKPVNGIQNVDASGKVVVTASEGKAGYTVNNADAIASEAVAALTAGTSYSGTFTYDEVAPSYDQKPVVDGAEGLVYSPHAGEKWIDVNLSNHTVTAYEGADVVYGPVSMVNGADATPTVTGTFHVYLKYETQTMKGENADGSNYETPDVPWISYFTGGYALHGAPWRNSFGFAGAAGSHGCVNMAVADAKWIFGWDEVGTPVVSHY